MIKLKQSRKVISEQIVIFTLLLIISLVFPLMILERMQLYHLPMGVDNGQWLTASYGLFGFNYPTWNENLLQSHPLLFFFIYPLAQVFGDVQVMNAIGLLVMVLRPIVMFFFFKKLFKNCSFALLCAAVDAFFPSYYEMYAWGGYPNLLGFIMLPIAFMFLPQDSSVGLKRLVLLFVLSTLTVLSHDLTSIIFLIVVYMLQFYKLAEKRYKLAFLTLLAVSLPFMVFRLLVGGVSDFALFNEFSYNACVIDMSKILFVFKNPVLLLSLTLLSAMGIYELFQINNHNAVLLLCWVLSPIIFYLGIYYTRFMAIDYVRLFFFIVQPFIISTVYSLKILWGKRNKLFVSGLVCLLIVFSFNFGYVTMNGAISWQQNSLENAHSDINSYDVVMWIKENLPNDSVIVSRAPVIGHFIEGISHKRVLDVRPLKFLARLKQFERSWSANAILTSSIFGHSDMFKIKDQTPISFQWSPFIYIFGGDDYKLLGYFSDHYPYELKRLTSNVSDIKVGNNSYEIVYSNSTSNYLTVKRVTLENDEIQVNYTVLQDPYKTPREKLGKSLYSNFWFDWGKNWDFVNGTLVTDYGNVEVITNAISVQKEYVSQWKQWRLVFSFNDDLSVTFKVKNIRIVKGNTVLTTRDDLIKLYGVTHALVRVDDIEAMKWIQSTGDWKLIYNNTLFYLYSLDITLKGQGAETLT